MAALLLVVVNAEVRAQQVPEAGSRIRFSIDSIHEGRWTTGEYIALGNHTLHMVSANGDTLNVPRPAIFHFQMSEGRYSHTKGGILVGAAVGAGVAGIMRRIGCSQQRTPRSYCAEGARVMLIGAAGGGLIGGVVGRVSKTDRWLTVGFERFP